MTAAKATIRPANAADLPAIGRLAGQLVRLHHAFDPARFLLVDNVEQGYVRYFRSELDDPSAIVLAAVAGEPGQVVGYAYARLEPRNWNDLLEACGKIHDLFVADEARGQGIGEALMREAIAQLESRGAPRVVLLSAWQNTDGQRLFEKLGFRRTMVEMTRERGSVA